MKHSKIVIANWKMQLRLHEALGFCTKNQEELLTLAQHVTLILCPSYEALYPLKEATNNFPLFIGAQNCSSHVLGAYTGQVSAASLKQLGCSYCIVGHSECRTLLNETNDEIARKAEQLLEQHIQPIICVGEDKKAYEDGITFDVLKNQLDPLVSRLAQKAPSVLHIAYEPVWAIGTEVIPSLAYLNKVVAWIHNYGKTYLPTTQCILLYGGSVSDKNAQEIASAEHIKGLLIGSASIDFQKFKNIVSLVSN